VECPDAGETTLELLCRNLLIAGSSRVESRDDMKAFPPPGKPMADRETKTEAELTALLLQTVRDAGFAWVEAVKLQSYPMRNPNWALTQIVGKAPSRLLGPAPSDRGRVAGTLSAKAQLAVRVTISTQQPLGHERGFRGDDTASSGGLAGPALRLADWGGAFISCLPLESSGAMPSEDFALLLGLALVALVMFVLQAFV
jgi:hypothetical protein